MKLLGKVAIVTGASRGLGRGIALELGNEGSTVYVTARGNSNSAGLGDVEAVAKDITTLGGNGIAVRCDQSDDEQLVALIKKVEAEQNRLDILVNNAFPVPEVEHTWGAPFWEIPFDTWKPVIDVGLRSHYVASVLAMPMLIKSKGLVVNVSSAGAQIYYGSVAYGIGKAGMDRMARDMAVQLNGTCVTTVAIWPGIVRTELTEPSFRERPGWIDYLLKMATSHFDFDPLMVPGTPKGLEATETPHFVGRAVAALAADPNVNRKAGRALAAVLLADEYGFSDIDGTRPDPFHFRLGRYWPALMNSDA